MHSWHHKISLSLSLIQRLPLSLSADCTHPSLSLRLPLSQLRSLSGISSVSRPRSQLLCLTPLQGARQIPAATLNLSEWLGRGDRSELLLFLHIRNVWNADGPLSVESQEKRLLLFADALFGTPTIVQLIITLLLIQLQVLSLLLLILQLTLLWRLLPTV